MPLNHQARKRFGQNFLIDTYIVSKLIQAIHPTATDHMIEVGPGQGALTTHLTAACHQVTAIELDRDLIPALARFNNLTVIGQDVLTVDFSQLTNHKGSLRIVGNLPYNISTPILFHLIEYYDYLQDLHFLLQKEVVERMAATPNSKVYGRLSVMVQRHFTVTPLTIVPPEAFSPAPKVVSQFVRLQPAAHQYPVKNEEHFALLVKQAFSSRRKTLWNNLKTLLPESVWLESNIDPSARAENVSVAEWVILSNAYSTMITE